MSTAILSSPEQLNRKNGDKLGCELVGDQSKMEGQVSSELQAIDHGTQSES